MSVHDLPAFNAVLNGLSAVLLLTARQKIKQGKRDHHRKIMIAAFCVSVVFLVSYLFYHYSVGAVFFQGTGIVRPFYFVLLTTHTILAAAVPVIATITLIRGLKGNYQSHRKIAKWTYPIWMYVSVTGVIIYFMLYQMYPPMPVKF